MKIYILIILLNICIIMQQIVIQEISKEIKQIKENNEILRIGFNHINIKLLNGGK